jgi:hypothetical protein
MRFAVILAGQCVFGVAYGCAGSTTAPLDNATNTEEAGVPAPKPFTDLRLAPVVRLNASDEVRVPLSLVNNTNETIQYASSFGSIVGLDYTLSRDGKVVSRAFTLGPSTTTNITVKELKPDERIIFYHRLNYTELKPGEYELQVTYEIHRGSYLNTKHGLTPVKFTQSFILVVTP